MFTLVCLIGCIFYLTCMSVYSYSKVFSSYVFTYIWHAVHVSVNVGISFLLFFLCMNLTMYTVIQCIILCTCFIVLTVIICIHNGHMFTFCSVVFIVQCIIIMMFLTHQFSVKLYSYRKT